MTLQGKAVPSLRPADSRSRFLEAFHNLLYLCSAFYKEDDDTTVKADAFPGAQRDQGRPPAAFPGCAQPVRRPALDGPRRRCCSSSGCWLGPSSASSCLPGSWSPTRSHGWTGSTHEDDPGLDRHDGPAIPPPGPLRRADLAVNPATATGARSTTRSGGELGRSWRQEVQWYFYAYQSVTGVDLCGWRKLPGRTGSALALPPAVHLAAAAGRAAATAARRRRT